MPLNSLVIVALMSGVSGLFALTQAEKRVAPASHVFGLPSASARGSVRGTNIPQIAIWKVNTIYVLGALGPNLCASASHVGGSSLGHLRSRG